MIPSEGGNASEIRCCAAGKKFQQMVESLPLPCGASRTAFPNWWVATELFKSIMSIIYLPDTIESGLALLFL